MYTIILYTPVLVTYRPKYSGQNYIFLFMLLASHPLKCSQGFFFFLSFIVNNVGTSVNNTNSCYILLSDAISESASQHADVFWNVSTCCHSCCRKENSFLCVMKKILWAVMLCKYILYISHRLCVSEKSVPIHVIILQGSFWTDD